MEQLQYEAESEEDDKLKAEKMKAFETEQAQVEALKVGISNAKAQHKYLKRTMRDVKNDALIRDAELKASKANAVLIVSIKQKQIWEFNAKANDSAVTKQENWRDGTKDEAKKAKHQATIDKLKEGAKNFREKAGGQDAKIKKFGTRYQKLKEATIGINLQIADSNALADIQEARDHMESAESELDELNAQATDFEVQIAL